MSKKGLFGKANAPTVKNFGLPEYSVRNRPRIGPTTMPGADSPVRKASEKEACGTTLPQFSFTVPYSRIGNSKTGTGGK